MRRRLLLVAIAFAALWHLLSLLTSTWPEARASANAMDFASYYYATHVAFDGGNPYDTRRVRRVAAADGHPGLLFPYLYPPPFLIASGWTLAVSPLDGYRAWFWVNEIFLWVAVAALWRWWQPLGPGIAVVLALAVATGPSIARNHLFGQANLPVMALTLTALWQEAERRPRLAGSLLGLACSLKPSPALFLLWWAVHRRWQPIAWCLLTGLLLLVASVVVLGPAIAQEFFVDVLPSLRTGDYGGLGLSVKHFGNHSLANLWAQAFPVRRHSTGLSDTARVGTAVTNAVLVAGLAVALWRARDDRLSRAAQAALVALATLLLPVFTWDHQLVWALPALALSLWAVASGCLKPGWIVPVAFAWLAWATPLESLKAVARGAPDTPLVLAGLREFKTLALGLLCVAMLRLMLGGAPGRARRR